MQNDEVIWQVINQNFCSFKIKTLKENFCKNEHNITGLCNRSSCPLANSRYATVHEHDGVLYLYIKTIERAHTPKTMWEKIKLSNNYAKALQTISEQLQFWPKFLIHKAKQRLTKITQYLMKMRKIKLSVQPELVGVHKKIDRREKVRAARAEKAAKIEDSIKAELVERLRQGTYEGIVNVPAKAYREVISDEEVTDSEQESDEEAPPEVVDDSDELEFIEGYEDEDEDDLEDMGEYEMEEELETPAAAFLSSKRKQPASSSRSAFDEDDFGEVSDDDDGDASDEEEEEEEAPRRKQPAVQAKKSKAPISIAYDDDKPSKAAIAASKPSKRKA